MNPIRYPDLILFAFLFSVCMYACSAYGMDAASGSSEAEQMLRDLVQQYRLEAPDSCFLVVQFNITAPGESWNVVVEPGKRVALRRGASDRAAFVFTLSGETLRRIYEGRMTAMTAGGKASGADRAPLEMEPTDAAAGIANAREVILSFLQHFFNASVPERILLREEHSRVVHGASVIPLYYAPGLRSAWYMVKKGQRLNEPGDTNPFPQALVIISGEGLAKIGDDTIRIRAGESYYIPPGSDHVVWTEADVPVVLIWLGWGGA